MAPLNFLSEGPVAQATGMESAVQLLGASLRVVAREFDPVVLGPSYGWLLGARTVLELSEDRLQSLKLAIRGQPVFLHPREREDISRVPEALERLTGCPAPATEGSASQTYVIARSSTVGLEPFAGTSLHEPQRRLFAATLPDEGPGWKALISGEGGSVFGRFDNGSGRLYVTTQPPLENFRLGDQLRKYFCNANFLELLPLMAFVRTALGSNGWRRPEPRAAFMIDDPNLRRHRYGWVDYRALSEAGREHNFHTIIAMSPIDARKTSAGVAQLFRDGLELSIVAHGVNHVRHEFDQDVMPARARSILSGGLATMDAHEQRYRVACPPVMTFPYARCSSIWLAAMRDVGMTAAINGPNLPFAVDLDVVPNVDVVRNAAYDMLPAEMSHRGFPVISRYFANRSLGNLLFDSWLGKPLILYLHGQDLRAGLEPLRQLAEFINTQIGARWCGAGDIVASNYQIRDQGMGKAVRMFSNRISVPVDRDHALLAIVKPDAEAQGDERLWVGDAELDTVKVRRTGVIAAVPPAAPMGSLRVVAGPRRDPLVRVSRSILAAPAHVRRALTELRDRGSPFLRRQ